MKKTLEMMKRIITGKENQRSEKELIKEYQESLSPNILAYFFTDNIGIINRTNTLYPILDEEDKASFCLQELDRCLINYNFENNNKFITYFMKCYKNRLRMETEQMLTQKRKVSLYSQELADEYTKEYDVENIDLILNNYNLTNTEKNQCKLLNEGYSIKEIAKILKQSTVTIYNRNAKIKQQISNSFINFG